MVLNMSTEDETVKIILELLERYGEMNATKISRLTGLHYHIVIKKLTELAQRGIVEERRYGRLRLFRLKDKPWALGK